MVFKIQGKIIFACFKLFQELDHIIRDSFMFLLIQKCNSFYMAGSALGTENTRMDKVKIIPLLTGFEIHQNI